MTPAASCSQHESEHDGVPVCRNDPVKLNILRAAATDVHHQTLLCVRAVPCYEAC